MCEGFSIVLPRQELVVLSEDCSELSSLKILVDEMGSVEELRASLLGLLETTFNRFSGKKATKRCLNINKDVISGSVKVLVYLMLDFIGKIPKKRRLHIEMEKLMETFKTQKTETSDYEIKLLKSYLKERQDILNVRDFINFDYNYYNHDYNFQLQPINCIITLETSEENLNSPQLKETLNFDDTSAWMEIIFQLTMCRLINVSFPLDVNLKPDFADAWSSHIKEINFSVVLTASSAVTIRDSSSGNYIDPICRQEYNAAVILAHPNDLILTQIYRCLTALPSLHGLIQSYLIAGGFKIFPSIVPGIQSACLTHLLRSSCVRYLKDANLKIGDKTAEMRQVDWEVARCLLWSLRHNIGVPGRSVLNSLKKGKGFNPVDAIPKLIAATVTYFNRTKLVSSQTKDLLLKLYEEMSADFISFVQKKLSNKVKPEIENDYLISDEQFVSCFIQNEENFSPCKKLHISEELIQEKVSLKRNGFENLEYLLITTKGFKYITSVFYSLCNLLEFDLTIEDFQVSSENSTKEISSLFMDRELGRIYTESFILKKRTSRYSLDADKEWKYLESRSEIKKQIKESVLDSIQEFYGPTIKKWNVMRDKFARTKLLNKAMNISGSTIEECSEKISNLSVLVVGKKYTLKRFDALDAIELIPDDSEKMKTIGAAFCIGNWTGEPPSQLRRNRLTVLIKFNNFPEIKEEMAKLLSKKSVCNRESPSSNRHGHHRSNQYPGATNWTQDYENERLSCKTSSRIRNILKKMKTFTIYLQELNKENSNLEKRSIILNKLTILEYELEEYGKVKNIADKANDWRYMKRVLNDKNNLIENINEAKRFKDLKRALFNIEKN